MTTAANSLKGPIPLRQVLSKLTLLQFIIISIVMIGFYVGIYHLTHTPPNYNAIVQRELAKDTWFTPEGRWTQYDRNLQDVVISQASYEVTTRREAARAIVAGMYNVCMTYERPRLLSASGTDAVADVNAAKEACATKAYSAWLKKQS